MQGERPLARPETFDDFCRRYGGAADTDTLFGSGPAAWLGDALRGLGTLADSYHGDTNRRGQVYAARHGVFDNMQINGAADLGAQGYVFGITLGAVLRLMHAQIVLRHPADRPGVTELLDYLLSADPNDPEPATAQALLAKPLAPQDMVQIQDRTFFSIAFVFLHEAFHTLIGHADFARRTLQLSLDELSLEREDGEMSTLIQAIELEADSAAFSNLWLTLRQSPKFGFCADPQPDPVERIAECTISGMTALLALEAQRLKRRSNAEGLHPFPSRRIGSVIRLLATYERRGQMPDGVTRALGRRAAALRPFFRGPAILGLLDLLAGDTPVKPEDAGRLKELMAIYREKLTLFEDLSYAPRIELGQLA